jgi:hypothetical protein
MTRNVPRTFRVACASVALVVGAAIAPLGLEQASAPPRAQPTTQPPATRAPAPAPAKRESLQITVVKVKPEMLDQWLEFQKNETIPMLKKAGIKSRQAWQTAVFGEGFMYGFVAPIEDFAQYDGDPPPVRALGADGARAYGEKNRRFLDSTRTFFAQTRPDLSTDMKTMTGPPKIAVISDIQIAVGKALEYEAFVKADVLPVMRKAKVGYVVSQTMLGGDVNEYTSLVFYDSFADLGKGSPFQRVLGPEGERQIAVKGAPFVRKIERNVLRYVPDLSFSAAPTS